MIETVCVIGLGYIGLPTAVALATQGMRVVGVDTNQETVNAINEGRAPFTEPDLAVALTGAVSMGRLRAQLDPEPADVFILTVPTPFGAEHKADLSFVKMATEAIAPILSRGNLVILESTSPPGTTVELSRWLQELRPDLRLPSAFTADHDVFVAHCPERVLPGRIMVELITNDRVIGGVSPVCGEQAAEIYRIFCQGECIVTDATTAELVKLTENSYRDVNIAFANEVSLICDRLGVDAYRTIELANRHPRVNILRPGPGVGGHCIAVDPWFVVSAAPDLSSLIRTAREVNDAKPKHVLEMVIRAAKRFHAPTVACLGLAFKANVEDLRESPAAEIATQLSASSHIGELLVVEPHLSALPRGLRGKTELADFEDALRRADIVVLLVGHDAFGSSAPASLQGKVVLDACGAWRAR